MVRRTLEVVVREGSGVGRYGDPAVPAETALKYERLAAYGALNNDSNGLITSPPVWTTNSAPRFAVTTNFNEGWTYAPFCSVHSMNLSYLISFLAVELSFSGGIDIFAISVNLD